MALDFFRIYRGLELDDAVQFLTGTGQPGAAGDTSTARIGSYYTDQVNGDLYTKIASGAGTDKWQRQATQSYVQTLLSTGVSWREPAKVQDDTATAIPTGSAGNPIVVDGISISDGERVLFSAIIGAGGPNVYIYDQTTGTFSEDPNNESDGDTVFIQEGTFADTTLQYNGTEWQIIATGTTNAELGFIRDYIGKPTAGGILPNYSSTNVVADNDSHITAISKLDAEAGFVNAFLGKAAGSDAPTYSSTTFVSNGNNIETAIGALDQALTDVTKQTTVNGGTSASDSVLAVMAEWDIWVRETAVPSRVWAGKLMAVQNGTGADHTTFGVLKIGGNIPVSANATLVGSNLVLNVSTGSTACDIRLKRITAIEL